MSIGNTVGNNRNIQPLNDRTILHFLKDRKLDKSIDDLDLLKNCKVKGQVVKVR